jgi:hypothetical protein
MPVMQGVWAAPPGRTLDKKPPISPTASPAAVGLMQSLSQGLLPGLSAWVEAGGNASSLFSKALLLPPIST